MAPAPYVELRCRSAFSFLDGASLPEDLATRAAELGYDALALSDVGGVYGAPRFFRTARKTGLRALVGAEVPLDGHPPLLLLVESASGYRNLCRLLTKAKAGRPKNASSATATHDDVAAHASGLLALGGAEPRTDWERLVNAFGEDRVYVERQRHYDDEQARRNAVAIAQADAYGVKALVTNDVRYATPRQQRAHDVLVCARAKVTVDEIGRRLPRNGERFLKPPEAMAALFADDPAAVARTRAVAERCAFTLADLGYEFPRFPVPGGCDEQTFLEQQTWAHARERFRPLTEAAERQIARELAVIGKLGLAGYFLVVWDIVRYAREKRILAQGRGSAANSAVCYALGITAIDPVKSELLFERFLSEERVRSAPNAADRIPDIDLDLPSGDRREDVIQYVYQRYGHRGGGTGAAMTANVITYRPRMAVRDTGRALGFSEDQLARIAKHLPGWIIEGETAIADYLTQAGFPPNEERTRLLASVATDLLNLPRHLGQHSGGMVLCAGRLDEVVPLEPASMPNRTVVQWDKDDCADLGIVKVDLLGLGMLAVLEDAAPLIAQHEGVAIDYAHLPADDPRVYAMLCAADTVGVFQVESRAQMATLPRMQPRTFYDLVVEVAIIRPGPIVGQMVNPYLVRRKDSSQITYPHPDLEPILKRTLGVPLFQEQLIKLAMVAAGFSGGQAEELRRAMGFKRSMEKMREIERDLRAGMAKNGIVGTAQDEIVQGIKSFALYGFPESHAASFALIAYSSAYLKAHHPAAFLCALLNNWPMGFYHPATLVSDAARHDVRTLPVDVSTSQWLCTLERDDRDRLAVRLGLRYVAGLREQVAQRLVTERAQARFVSLGDLQARVQPRERELAALAETGALGSLGGSRRAALWQVEALGRSGPLFAKAEAHSDGTTGEEHVVESPLPEMSAEEATVADLRGTGITLGPHPVAAARAALTEIGVVKASELGRLRHGARTRIAGVVIVRQRPMTAKGIVFMTLEDETGFTNAVVMPDLFARDKSIILSHAALIIDGVLQNRHGVLTVRAERFAPLPGAASAVDRSHDFR